MSPGTAGRWLRYVVAVSMLAAPVAQAQHYSILYHERVENLVFRNPAERAADAAKPVNDTPTLSFVAFGRQFDAELESNDALMRGLSAEQRQKVANLHLYRGRLAGNPQSWVRLGRIGAVWSGVIWDGKELYGVDDFRKVAAEAGVADATPTDATAIYRWSDTAGALKDIEVAGEAAMAALGTGTAAVTSEAGAPTGPGKQIDLGLIADVEYVRASAGQATANLLSMLNVVDGIFTRQVGVHLNAPVIETFDTEADPFTAPDPSGLLNDLENHKGAVPSLRTLGAVHLFTGRNLVEPSDSGPGEIIGIANRGSLCDATLSAGVTQGTYPTGTAALIFAHELGHNFGAPHDDTAGSACSAVGTGYIMESHINGSMEFSTCSVTQMASTIAGASCLRNLPASDVSLKLLMGPPASMYQDDSAGLHIRIENNQLTDAFGPELTIAAPGFASPGLSYVVGGDDSWCRRDASTRCVWKSLAAGQAIDMYVSFYKATSGGLQTIDLTATSLNDADDTNGKVHFEVQVLGWVDLSAMVTEPEGLALHPGALGFVQARIANLSAAPAADVWGRIWFDNAVEVLDTGLGSACTFDTSTFPSSYDCHFGALGAGATRAFDIRIRAKTGISTPTVGGVDVEARTQQHDTDLTNNRHTTRVTIGDALADVALTLTGPDHITVAQPYEFQLRVDNVQGLDVAKDVTVSDASSGNALPPTFSAIRTTRGTCTMTPPNNAFVCTLGDLGVGQSATITFTGAVTTADTYGFQVLSRTTSADFQPNNDSAAIFPQAAFAPPPVTPVPVTPALVPSSGGGGGSSDAVLLALLVSAMLFQRRREFASQKRR